MATDVHSVILQCSSSFGASAALRPGMVPAPSLMSVRRSSFSSAEFSGLKIQNDPGSALASLNSRTSRAVRGGGRIVCEAQQEAALDVPIVTDATWQSLVLDATGPVLVEFWAPWCGPCRMIHPVIDELSEEYAGKLKCFKLNTDDSPSIATQYGIRSIPTIMIFISGEKKDAVIGAVPKTALTSSIEKFL